MEFKNLFVLPLALFSTLCFANTGLQPLTNQEMSEVEGQGGADLSLSVSINHAISSDPTKLSNTYECKNGANQFCRLAVSYNNRKDANGNMYWLVAKKLQGTMAIDKFQLDGTTVKTGTGTYRSAVKLTFLDGYPLQMRNVGFESLAIETDTGSTDAQKGYLSTTKPSNYTGFDANLERGFMGLNMNGNLAAAGSIKIFSCTPSSASRC